MARLFRSEAQKNAVCQTLAAWNGLERLWNAWPHAGPSERCGDVIRGEVSAVGVSETTLARILFALWEGRGELRFGHLLPELPPTARQSVDSLLEALLGPGDALDAWVEEHGFEGAEVSEHRAAPVPAQGP